ncbi:MAG: hypothetical protein H0W72_02780 [Planctomycetes bacterium]|nr:hypothetical protein [Planctomycetota bacterium]
MPQPPLIQNRQSFHEHMERACLRSQEKIASNPDWDLPQNIVRQLLFMKQCTDDGRIPTADEREKPNVGVLAMRNFEESDEEFASWLSGLNYAFRRYHQLPG